MNKLVNVIPKVEQEKIKIQIDDMSKTFLTRKGQIQALQPSTLEIAQGEFCVIVGPSGCGKTTLLRILAGLEKPSNGRVHIDQEDEGCPLTSMVFQEDSIFPWMTVRQNVAYGLNSRGVPRKERDEMVQFWIEKVGLSRFRD